MRTNLTKPKNLHTFVHLFFYPYIHQIYVELAGSWGAKGNEEHRGGRKEDCITAKFRDHVHGKLGRSCQEGARKRCSQDVTLELSYER